MPTLPSVRVIVQTVVSLALLAVLGFAALFMDLADGSRSSPNEWYVYHVTNPYSNVYQTLMREMGYPRLPDVVDFVVILLNALWLFGLIQLLLYFVLKYRGMKQVAMASLYFCAFTVVMMAVTQGYNYVDRIPNRPIETVDRDNRYWSSVAMNFSVQMPESFSFADERGPVNIDGVEAPVAAFGRPKEERPQGSDGDFFVIKVPKAMTIDQIESWAKGQSSNRTVRRETVQVNGEPTTRVIATSDSDVVVDMLIIRGQYATYLIHGEPSLAPEFQAFVESFEETIKE